MSKEAKTGIRSITAKVTALGTEVTAEFNLGVDLDEAVELYGHDVVYSLYARQFHVAAQAVERSAALVKDADGTDRAATPDEFEAKVSKWKPGVIQRSGKSKTDKVKDLYEKMSPEEQAAFDAYLESRAAE